MVFRRKESSLMNKYSNNKDILEFAPNYLKIVNMEFYEGDKVSEKLIKLYEEFVFSIDLSSSSQKTKLKTLDIIMNKYINDLSFRKELVKRIDDIRVKTSIKDSVTYIVNKIIEIFNNYEESYTRNIYIPRWI